ncbi:MAG TPA: 3-hydroxyacyl-CoA dehydrogenase NAD-binding domain-containing protein, partial [Burkholderiales bacterium]|nr:3-hydroxyacyl-CoA dehydrogenase NAD-binding domain-containing protein [Burkholderiales bacterium]
MANNNYKHWKLETDRDKLAWLSFDKQGASTNTLSQEALAELDAALEEVRSLAPRGLVIRSAKASGFIAGADVEEFTRIESPQDALALVRRGWDTFNKLAALPFPTVALIDGFCMGGGLELALACRYRIAVDQPGTRLALPEVMLGILPGWGGVKRLPRLVGPMAALDMLMTGRSVDARRARRMGLVDAAVPARIKENAARMTALEAPRPRRLPLAQAVMNMPLARPLIAAVARRQLRARARPEHYPAPYAILALWERYDGDPLAPHPDDPASVASLAASDTTQNLIRIFFLQERLKSLGKESDFRARHVHVVGAGVMGGDIAAWCAMRGLTVTLQDQSAERLAPAMKRARDLFERRLRDRARVRDAVDRLVPDTAGEGARRADVIIEAIFENLDAKRELFARLEGLARPDAVLASNTSSLKLADIAQALRAPARLVGIHFFNPVPQMQLVEVVSGAQTDREAAKKASAFVRQIDKLPLPVRDASGFLVNRVLGPYLTKALQLVDQGTAPETLDAAATAFGMPMGPIELADTVGLDICLAVGKELSGGRGDPPRKLAELVASGNLGRKTGRGFYAWKNGRPQKRAPAPVPDDLADTLLAPYLDEAEAAVAQGVVADADLADAGLIFATGFAPFRGGPLHY